MQTVCKSLSYEVATLRQSMHYSVWQSLCVYYNKALQS